MTVQITDIATGPHHIAEGRGTPEQVLASIVDGINTGNLDALMSLYESSAAFATQPGSLAHGRHGIRGGLAGFIAMRGTLKLNVTRVLEASGLALVIGVWSFAGTGPDGQAVSLTGHSADVLRLQSDGSWRFVIDNPWGTKSRAHGCPADVLRGENRKRGRQGASAHGRQRAGDQTPRD